MADLIACLCRDGRDLLMVTLIMNGMDAKEVASILGVSPSHVSWLRSRLAQELSDHAGWLAEEKRRRTGAWPRRRRRTRVSRRRQRRRACLSPRPTIALLRRFWRERRNPGGPPSACSLSRLDTQPRDAALPTRTPRARRSSPAGGLHPARSRKSGLHAPRPLLILPRNNAIVQQSALLPLCLHTSTPSPPALSLSSREIVQ